jgi:hypothetical protein
MRNALRLAAVAAALAGSAVFGGTPASAVGVGGGIFEGYAHIDCFGCGAGHGTAELCVTGAAVSPVPPPPPPSVRVFGPQVCLPPDGPVIPPVPPTTPGPTPNTSATYSVQEDGGANCVITGSATGTTTGAVNTVFNWTRIGAVAVISTTGDINGQGVAAFIVTSPKGLPCGGAVEAYVAGALVGTTP